MRDNWFITNYRVMQWQRVERVNVHLFVKTRIKRSMLNFINLSSKPEARQAAALLKATLPIRGSSSATSSRCSISGRSRFVIKKISFGRMGAMNLARDSFIHGFRLHSR